MNSWLIMATAIDDLVTKCYTYPDEKSAQLLEETFGVITSFRTMQLNNPLQGIQETLIVGGQSTAQSEKLAYPEHTNNMVWLGCLTTGDYPNEDSLQEICLIITDPQLNIIAQSPIFELNQGSDIANIELLILDFVKHHTKEKPTLLGQDRIGKYRALLKKCMPTLESYFSTVTMNCFSIRELSMFWQLDVYQRNEVHSALQSAYEAIAEVKFYKERYFNE
jgi:oligoribonuclease